MIIQSPDYDGPKVPSPIPSKEFERFSSLMRCGPTELVVVRHGFSEANFAQKQRKLDPKNKVVSIMAEVEDTEVRLRSPLGLEQAKAAGLWIRQKLGFMPVVGYVSDFTRAQETAGVLGQAAGFSGMWHIDPLIGERSWGRLHSLSDEAQAQELLLRDMHVRHWTPAHGESIKAVEAYVRDFLNSIWRKYPGQRVLIVTHGEFILALQAVMEKFTPEQLRSAGDRGFPNCGILNYSRFTPDGGPLALSPSFNHIRRVCPWDPNWKSEDWSGSWREIVRPKFTNDELLARAEMFPRRLTMEG